MALSRPRLQVVQNDEIAKAIETIRKHRPGLINDSMLVTSALVEHALGLESDKPRNISYPVPYSMMLWLVGSATHETGIFQFLIQEFRHIVAIFAHIDNKDDTLMDYISRGEKPVYTFVVKTTGSIDFKFIHIATDGSFFEECLTLLALDFKQYRDDIRFNVIRTNRFMERSGQKFTSRYVPNLDEMARIFCEDEIRFGCSEETLCKLNSNWETNITTYKGFKITDTRYVDYSHAFSGLKESSRTEEKYGVENLVRSGVLSVQRDLLHHRYRCTCDEWTKERQELDLYELGNIFGQHFGYKAIFSPAKFLDQVANSTSKTMPKATIYIEKGKRIEVLPMEWERSWFTCNVDGKASGQGLSLLRDDPNPFTLYDMNDFFPDQLEQYKQEKKNSRQ